MGFTSNLKNFWQGAKRIATFNALIMATTFVCDKLVFPITYPLIGEGFIYTSLGLVQAGLWSTPFWCVVTAANVYQLQKMVQSQKNIAQNPNPAVDNSASKIEPPKPVQKPIPVTEPLPISQKQSASFAPNPLNLDHGKEPDIKSKMEHSDSEPDEPEVIFIPAMIAPSPGSPLPLSHQSASLLTEPQTQKTEGGLRLRARIHRAALQAKANPPRAAVESIQPVVLHEFRRSMSISATDMPTTTVLSPKSSPSESQTLEYVYRDNHFG